MSRSGLDGVLPLLACPHCAHGMTRLDGVVGCPAGHRFDVARQGHLSLLGSRSRTDTGDSADMVAARVDFLGAGHYRPLAEAIADRVVAGPVLEIGAGTGYYLAAVLQRLAADPAADARGLAIDASRYAARRSAAEPAIGSIVADAWSRLPVRHAVIGTVLSVFAARDPGEIVRVLAPGGRLVVATPEPDHLAEIRTDLGLLTVDPGKVERLADSFAGRLRLTERDDVRVLMRLSRRDVAALVRMGPSARHLAPGRLAESVAALPETTFVTLAISVSVFAAGRL